jgi:hypothetical protein
MQTLVESFLHSHLGTLMLGLGPKWGQPLEPNVKTYESRPYSLLVLFLNDGAEAQKCV